MTPSILVIIREDPTKSPKPVEGLRIALGLSAATNPVTIILLHEAARLLGTDDVELQDGDVLEKYLPSLKHLAVAFIVSEGTCSTIHLDPEFHVREASPSTIGSLTASADRVLAF